MAKGEARTIAARGLTAFDRGRTLVMEDGYFIKEGFIQSVDWFDKSMSITLTVTIDIPNMRTVQVIDR